MTVKLKPCPFCGLIPILRPVSGQNPLGRSLVKCEISGCPCEGSFTHEQWNNRPSEDKLKTALDIFIKAVAFSLDENFKYKMRNRRLQDALDDVRKLLGIAKSNK